MFKQLTFRSDRAFWPSIEQAEEFPKPWAGSIARVFSTILRELKARRAMQSLAGLDDRMLRDVGIERSQIENACRYGREQPFRVSDSRADLLRWS